MSIYFILLDFPPPVVATGSTFNQCFHWQDMQEQVLQLFFFFRVYTCDCIGDQTGGCLQHLPTLRSKVGQEMLPPHLYSTA